MPLIAGDSVVTPQGELRDGWVLIEGTTITAVGTGVPPRPADRTARWVLPGFVDVHAHGGGGASVVGADPDEVRRFVETHRRHGSTSITASLVSADLAELERDVAALATLADEQLIAGIHLEGPWISPAHRGAHDPAALRIPDPSSVGRLLRAGRGHVRVVTVAPELENGLDAVRAVLDGGAVAAIGHTAATDAVTRAAIDAGARAASHLFNAMRAIHHREPGPVLALLDDERVTVELILDGVHLHPGVARHAMNAVGPRRLALVTDAMAAAGAGDGVYQLGSLEVQVRDGVARLAGGGAIAGSTLTMDRAFRFAVQDVGWPVVDAVHAASTTPARLLGLSGHTGALAGGLWADVVLMDAGLRVEAVMVRGTWVN